MTPEKALKKAIKIIGGCGAVGRLFHPTRTRQSVRLWKKCPPIFVIGVAEATDGRVTRHDLRPDIYPEK
jgi:DNA-binding transcriptional regulator YdaS (Cro superfamily)